jgi:hypothetical protein
VESRNLGEQDTNLNSFKILEYRGFGMDLYPKALAGLTPWVVLSSLGTNNTSEADRAIAPSFLIITDDEENSIAFGLNNTLTYVDKETVKNLVLSMSSIGRQEEYLHRQRGGLAARWLQQQAYAGGSRFEHVDVKNTCLLAQEEVPRQLREIWQTEC